MSEMPKTWIELIYLLAPAFFSAASTVAIALAITQNMDTEWLYPAAAGASTLTAQILTKRKD